MKLEMKDLYDKFEQEMKSLLIGKSVYALDCITDMLNSKKEYAGVVKDVEAFVSTYDGYTPLSRITFEDGVDVLVSDYSIIEIENV